MIKVNSGFSLLELLTVMAISAMLSAIAIPAYTRYLTRAKLTELFTLADIQKLKIIDNLTNGVQLKCTSAGGTAVKPFSKYVENILYWQERGEYVIQLKTTPTVFNQASKDFIVEFRGIERDGMVSWECAVPKAYSELLAGRCGEQEVVWHVC